MQQRTESKSDQLREFENILLNELSYIDYSIIMLWRIQRLEHLMLEDESIMLSNYKERGSLPVKCALYLKNEQLATFFLSRGVDINEESVHGCLLALALEHGLDDFVISHLQNNKSLSNNSLRYIFVCATRKDKTEIALMALEKAKEYGFVIDDWKDDPLSQTDYKPLHLAAWHENLTLVKALCAAGADQNAKARGKTPLDVAFSRSHLYIIKDNELAIIEALSKGQAAIEAAFNNNHHWIVDKILRSPTVTVPASVLNKIILAYVSRKEGRALNAIKKLEEQQSEITDWATDDMGNNALHEAVRCDCAAIAKALYEQKNHDKLNVPNHHQQTPFELALAIYDQVGPGFTTYSSLSILHTLLKSNPTFSLGKRCQQIFAQALHAKLTDFATYLVLHHGANINTTIDGKPLLSYTYSRELFDFIKSILDPDNGVEISAESLSDLISKARRFRETENELIVLALQKAKQQGSKITLLGKSLSQAMFAATYVNKPELALFAWEQRSESLEKMTFDRNINSTEENILHLAVTNRNLQLIEVLITQLNFSFLYQADKKGRTPLAIALSNFEHNQSLKAQNSEEEKGKDKENDNDDIAIIRLLLSRETNRQMFCDAYHALITHGYSDVILELVKKAKHVNLGGSLITQALRANNLELAAALENCNSHFSEDDDSSCDVILKHIDEGHPEFLEILTRLLKESLKIEPIQYLIGFERIITHAADKHDAVRKICFILKFIEDKHLAFSLQGNTSLVSLAMEKAYLDLADLLLRQGAKVDPTACTAYLRQAIAEKNEDLALELIKQGADVNAPVSNKTESEGEKESENIFTHIVKSTELKKLKKYLYEHQQDCHITHETLGVKIPASFTYKSVFCLYPCIRDKQVGKEFREQEQKEFEQQKAAVLQDLKDFIFGLESMKVLIQHATDLDEQAKKSASAPDIKKVQAINHLVNDINAAKTISEIKEILKDPERRSKLDSHRGFFSKVFNPDLTNTGDMYYKFLQEFDKAYHNSNVKKAIDNLKKPRTPNTSNAAGTERDDASEFIAPPGTLPPMAGQRRTN